jgi:hypothetical protein
MMVNKTKLTIYAIAVLLASCKDTPNGSHGPIKFGDPATIVTESDSTRLQDLVSDLKPAPAEPPVAATVSAATSSHTNTTTPTHTATVAPSPLPTSQALAGNGLKIEFKEVSILLPNVTAKQFGKTDLSRANGAVYSWVSGTIPGNMLKVSGATITKVSQRYQVVSVLEGKNGDLPLESLGATTSWVAMQGSAGSYPVRGLAEKELTVPAGNENAIKNAVTKSARARRLSHSKTQEWLQVLGKNVRTANQRPLVVSLRSVMWKIDGKDAQGKMFSKQIRIDFPM